MVVLLALVALAIAAAIAVPLAADDEDPESTQPTLATGQEGPERGGAPAGDASDQAERATALKPPRAASVRHAKG